MQFKKNFLLAVVLALCLCLPSAGRADPLDDLDNTFDNLSTYYSAPTYYHGPTRSGFSLGNFRTFLPNSKVTPLTFEPPDIHASCGGISMYGGGFSFISADKFVAMLQNIMASASGYFFEMAIEQLCPTCHNIMSLLRHASQLAQKTAMDSCGMGKKLAETFGPKLLEHASISKSIEDSGSDWIKEADKWVENQLSGDHSMEQAAITNDKKSCDPKTGKNCITGNYVYEIVTNSGGKKGDAQVVMSLIGTYIWAPNAGNTNVKPSYKPPVLTAAMLATGCENAGTTGLKSACVDHGCFGNNVPVYECNDDKCLSVIVSCRSKEDLVERVKDSLTNLIDNKLDKRESVSDAGSLGVFYYTPIVKEMWNAAKYYPKSWREPLLDEIIDTSSQAFVYLYLEGYLESVRNHLINPHNILIGPVNNSEEQITVISRNINSRFSEVETLKKQSFDVVDAKIANLKNLLQVAQIVNSKNQQAERSMSANSKGEK